MALAVWLRLGAALGLAALAAIAPCRPASATSVSVSQTINSFNAIIRDSFNTGNDLDQPLVLGGTLSGGLNYNNQTEGFTGPTSFGNFGTFNIYGTVTGGSYQGAGAANFAGTTGGGTFQNFSSVNTGYSFTNAVGGAVSFNNIYQPYVNLSANLGALATNVASSSWSAGAAWNIAFNTGAISAGQSDVDVLNITASTLAGVSANSFNVTGMDANSILVINVTGDVNFSMPSSLVFAQGAMYQHIIWNFVGGSTINTVTLTNGLAGTVLGTNTDFSIGNNINGTIIAAAVTGGHEIHWEGFAGSTTSLNALSSVLVPEPSSLAVLAAGLAGLGLARRRRRG